MKLKLLVSIAIAAQVFSTAALAGNEGKTGDGVCAQYAAFVSDIAERLSSLKPEVVKAANRIIDPTKLQDFALRIKCRPEDALASGRVAETSETATGFETRLRWKSALHYKRLQFVDLASEQMAVALKWEAPNIYNQRRQFVDLSTDPMAVVLWGAPDNYNQRRQFVDLASEQMAVALKWEAPDFYSNVKKDIMGLYFQHYIGRTDFPTKCLGESGFDATGQFFTCVDPRLEQNGSTNYVSAALLNLETDSQRPPRINDVYQHYLCQRMGFSKTVQSHDVYFEKPVDVTALTGEGMIAGISKSNWAVKFVSCE